MNDSTKQQNFSVFVLITSMVTLPACDWFKAKQDQDKKVSYSAESTQGSTISAEKEPLTGQVIASMDGKAIVTVDSLQEEKEKIFKANPQWKSMMAFMDESQFDYNIAEGLVQQAVIEKFVHENGIDQQQNYINEMTEGIRAIKRMINTKFASESFSISVSDAKVKQFYEENKNLVPNLIISRGGVRASGIMFTTQEQAQTFLNAVKNNNNDLAAAARANNVSGKIVDFKFVNEQSNDVEPLLREKIVSVQRTPTSDMVKTSDTSFWVFSATSKEESKYRPFDENVKRELKRDLEKEERQEKFEEKINEWRQEYNVVFNKDHFGQMESEEDEEGMLAAELSNLENDKETSHDNKIV